MLRPALFPGIALGLASTTLHAQYTPPDPSGLEGIVVETYYIADGNDAADQDGSTGGLVAGAVTYRVFADLKPGYKLLTVGGFTDHPITFSTTTDFFNNEDRGEAWGDGIDHTHLDDNTVAIDSWLSMGGASDAHWGIPKADDTDGSIVGGVNNDGGSNSVPGGLLVNHVPAMGLPLTQADGLLPGTPPATSFVGTPPDIFNLGGSSYSSTDAAWAALGGAMSPDPGNKLLIGQFTTDGEFSFCLNLWVKIPDSLVCSAPECHQILEFYGNLLPSDTAGTSISGDNKFTFSSLCFTSSTVEEDCAGVPGGTALPGTPCDDGDPDTANDTYAANCDCLGEDCAGVPGGTALPGTPCDDGDPTTADDVWQTGCNCSGTVGIHDADASTLQVSMHPNPTNDLVWIGIEGASGERTTYTLRNVLGERVAAKDLGMLNGPWKGTIDLSRLGTGVYFLDVTMGASTRTQRITRL